MIRRTGAFGDVVAATPVTRRIRKEKPGAIVHFITQYPAVFEGNTDVQLVNPTAPKPEDYDRLIDLDLAFERRGRRLHATDCYFLEAFGDVGDPRDKQPHMAPLDGGEKDFDLDAPLGYLEKRIVVAPSRSAWQMRTLSQDFWQRVVDRVREKAHTIPVVTGTSQDWALTRVLDMRDALTPREQVQLVQHARVLIGGESGVTGGIAPCTDTPFVMPITMGTFEIAAPYRKGRLGADFYPVFAKVDCHGCTTRQPGVVTFHGCERVTDKFVCNTTFDPVAMADLALEVSKRE